MLTGSSLSSGDSQTEGVCVVSVFLWSGSHEAPALLFHSVFLLAFLPFVALCSSAPSFVCRSVFTCLSMKTVTGGSSLSVQCSSACVVPAAWL